VACDISPQAVAVAKANAEALGVADRVDVRMGDLLTPARNEIFDIMVSNPPYIPSAVVDTLSIDVRSEPRTALDGGGDGLLLIRRLVATASRHLQPGGLLVIEHGHDQARAVAELISATMQFDTVAMRRDLGGNPRVSCARTTSHHSTTTTYNSSAPDDFSQSMPSSDAFPE